MKRRGLPPTSDTGEGAASATDWDAIVIPLFDKPLTELGFERAHGKLWVRREFAPVCHIFSLDAYGSTGSTYAPTFGLSLDFVPHLAAQKIAWHRTAKSARYDLRFEMQSRWFGIHRLHSERVVRAEASFAVPRALWCADMLWDQIRTVHDWPQAKLRHRVWYLRRAGRLYDRMVFSSPADAFVAARTGDLELGRELLDAWLEVESRVTKHPIGPDVPDRLRQLLAQAAAEP